MTYLLIAYTIYALGVQYLRGGAWRIVAPFTVVALLMSWTLNQTLARVIYGKPADWKETFSKHTARTVGVAGWRGRIARLVAALLNFAAHDEKHIH
jgi:hypothetical protein